jgi:hypothetical protein
LKASEYTAKFNLNESVPYDPRWYRCEAVLVGGPWQNISREAYGITPARPVWDILYYEYVARRGLDGPWTTKAKEATGFEGHLDTGDLPSWGDLIWAV